MTRWTNQQQLDTIEYLVEQYRWARGQPDRRERETYLVLKSIAADIRARQIGEPLATLAELDEAIWRAGQTKTKAGYEPGHLRAIAEIVIGRFAVIRQALERFEKETTE